MTLTFDLKSTRDLFAKLRRDAEALEEEVTSDRLFNFCVTGYSMIDWVKNDPNIPDAARTAAVVKGLRNDQWLKVCGDLANACKHFKLEKRIPVTDAAISTRGWGIGRYGTGGYGISEESIDIQLNDSRSFQCLDLVKKVLATWQDFFNAHGI
jgi:hypothetical protein